MLPPSTAPPSHCTPPVMNTHNRRLARAIGRRRWPAGLARGPERSRQFTITVANYYCYYCYYYYYYYYHYYCYCYYYYYYNCNYYYYYY